MTIATAKEKSASERFMLVRITPARDVSASLSSAGSGVYTMTFPYPVAKVERNGAELTKVATVSNNDEYSFDEDTQAFQVKLAAAPDSDDNIVVVYYHLFYTGSKSRIAPTDPQSAASASNLDRLWEPLLISYPSVHQSVKNATAGVLTIAASNIVLRNDGSFVDYLTDNDSFYQKDVTIWLGIDSTANLQKVLVGKVSRVSLDRETVTFNIYDSFALLKQSAYMGDTADDCFPDSTNDAQKNKPIPYMVGNHTRYREVFNHDLEGTGDGGTVPNPGDMLEAICTSYNATVSTSNNRTWTLCRTNSEGFSAGLTGTSIDIESIDDDATVGASSSARVIKLGWNNITTLHPVNGYSQNYFSFHVRCGDTVKVTRAGGGVQYGIVIEVFDFTGGYVKAFFGSTHGTVTVGDTMEFFHRTALVITNGAQYWYPCYGRDFTVSAETLASGNKLLKVTFTNNFESNFPDIVALTPDRFAVKFRTFHGGLADPNDGTSTAWRPQNFLKSMMNAAGIACATDSFDGGEYNVALGSLLFSIPLFEENDFGGYREYAELILRSVLGYVSFNGDFEAVFGLFGAPSSSTIVDQTALLYRSSSVDIDYEDIITDLRLENPDSGSSEIASDTQAKRLHGISKTHTERSVLEHPSDADRQLPFYSSRRAVYRFETATQHIDAQVGDDLTLETPDALGGSGTTNLKIISIDKSTDKTTIEATDLKGL